MTKRILSIIAAILVLSIQAQAQKLKTAFDKYENGDFAGAYTAFKKALQDPKESPTAFYGMGLVFSNKNNPRYNNIIAYSNFVKAKQKMLEAPNDWKNYQNITPEMLDAAIDSTTANDFRKAENRGTKAAYLEFLRKFKDAPTFSQMARQRIIEIDNTEAQALGENERMRWSAITCSENTSSQTLDSLKEYLTDYAGTNFLKARQPQIDSLKKALYNNVLANNDYIGAHKLLPYYKNDIRLEWCAVCKDLRYANLMIRQTHEFIFKYSYSHDFPGDDVNALLKVLKTDALNTSEPSAINAYLKYFEGRFSQQEKQRKDLADRVYQEIPFLEEYQDSHKPIYEEYIAKAAPCELAYVAVLRLMKPYVRDQKYDEAANLLRKYKPMFPAYADRIDKTISLLIDKAPVFDSIQQLPASINDGYVGYPVLSDDGSTLYFAKYPIPFNHPISQAKQFDEDIFLCDYNDGQCDNVRPIKNINKKGIYERPLAMHPDGSKLLYYTHDCVYIANLYDNNGIVPFSSINRFSKSWVSDAQFTHDGNAVLFCAISDQDMGYTYQRTTEPGHGALLGNSDIYVCLKDKNGKWGKIINLGSVINTPYGEYSPVLASDMKTLYFCSDGHYGLGGTDLFMSKRLSEDSWTEWSEPVNLGRNINTCYDDNNLFIASDGKRAFYAKNDKIISFLMPQEVKADPVLTLKGTIKNTKEEPVPATLKWEDLTNGTSIGDIRNNPTNGEYFVTLPLGKNYGYVIEADGYYPTSGNINTSGDEEAIVIRHNITLDSQEDILKTGKSIVLNNIFFETAKYDLKPESHNELKRLAKFMKESDGIRIEISGHTDNVGSNESNIRLSYNRANSVKEYLVSLGIPKSCIIVKGFGASMPIDDNDTPKGRANNRRVEFKVVEE